MEDRGILVVGSMNVDMVVKTSRIPSPGETLLGGVFQKFEGGKGANQAVAATRYAAARISAPESATTPSGANTSPTYAGTE